MNEGGSIRMTSCTSSGSNSIKSDDLVIKNIYWLVNSKNELYKIPIGDKDRLSGIIKEMSEKETGFIESQSGNVKIIGA
jgi:hypothetical protein